MPYLPLDLDAREKIALIGRALGVSPGDILWGLTDLWKHAWRLKSEIVGELYLTGCIGSDERLRRALIEADFIERIDTHTYRVRGTKKWLLGLEGRSRGGHAAKANLIPGAIHRLQPKASPRPADDPPSAEPSALTSSIQHPASSKESKAIGVEPPPSAVRQYEKPVEDPEAWTAEQFFEWAQWERQGAKLLGEKPPHPRKLSVWFSQAQMALSGDTRALKDAFLRYGEDKFWQSKDPPLPFGGFMSQWDKYVRGLANVGT